MKNKVTNSNGNCLNSDTILIKLCKSSIDLNSIYIFQEFNDKYTVNIFLTLSHMKVNSTTVSVWIQKSEV